MPSRNLPRRALPEGAKALRDALYAGGRLPSHEEKISVYGEILAQVPYYSRHRHLTWCSGKDKQARAQTRQERQRLQLESSAAAQAQADLQRAMAFAEPYLWWYYCNSCNPMGPTFFEMRQWAGEAAVSVATMADAIDQLTLRHAQNLPLCPLHLCLSTPVPSSC
uniref:Non-ribosomal peptide synthetase SyfB n=1 Tax=Ganoderma boninense TaxID=34458 RepID=A0A5K1JSS1_9APHY|nr:Non-ribosomal peptide synthetase SyfB [Ganoderma boninense]